MPFRFPHSPGARGALTASEWTRLTSALTPRRLERKQCLLTPGDPCDFDVFVHTGCLRVYFSGERGTDRVLYFATEGWWIADAQDQIGQLPSTMGIDALEHSELLVIEGAKKERLCKEAPQFERFFRLAVQTTAAALQRRLISAMQGTGYQRYLEFKRDYPTLEGRIAQYHIASYLGICPEFLSRLRRRRGTDSGR